MRAPARPLAPRLALLLFAAACTTGRRPGDAAAGPAAPAPRPDPSVISQAEIAATQQSSVYELVAVLRPRWLVLRGRDTLGPPNPIRAYLGTTRLPNGLEQLRTIAPLGITRIEFFAPAAAAARWGLDHSQGAVVVSAESR